MICSFKTVEQKQNSSIFLNQEKDGSKILSDHIFVTVRRIWKFLRSFGICSWIDIGIMFDSFDIYFFKSNFHTLAYDNFLKRIRIRSNYNCFFWYNTDNNTLANSNFTTSTFPFFVFRWTFRSYSFILFDSSNYKN